MPDVLAAADGGADGAPPDAALRVRRQPEQAVRLHGASLPVVCNVPGEVAEMVAAAEAGVQAEPGSGASLAEAILAARGCVRRRTGRDGPSGRAWVAREHGREVLAERLDGDPAARCSA